MLILHVNNLHFRAQKSMIISERSKSMVLKRKLYQKLLDWKNKRKGRSALLICGARRVGKSFLCEQFGKNEYKSMIFIDFANVAKEVIDVFENESSDMDLFFEKISAYYRTPIFIRESLIVFDEVQLYPRARQLIKYLVADGRYDFIETGSLLSIKRNVKDIVIPSEEERLDLYPLDFEEFLWALGDETTIPFTRRCFEQREPLGQALHRKTMNDFRRFMLVGGMPQAVLEYIEKKDFGAVDEVKRMIITLYRNDISRFAGGYESKVNSIFDEIPGQLSKKEKKFKLSSIDKDARMRSYEDAFMWLCDAMIINPCFNATDPNVGLAISGDHSTQKIYMADTGLLVTQAFMDNAYTENEIYRAVLFDKLQINEGMIMENMVAQMLKTCGHQLYFYSRVDSANRKNMMEIDFLVSNGRKISPVEVKTSVYKTHSSLDKFRNKFSSRIGESFILYTKDVIIKDNVVHLPVYMAMFL